MPSWLIFIILYTIIKSLRDSTKKLALTRSPVAEVLFYYSLIAFLCIIPFSSHVFSLSALQICKVFVKSLVIFIAWICAFNGIKSMPIGLYGVLDMARMVCSILLAVLVLRETLSGNQIIGLVLIASGLLAVNAHRRNEKQENTSFWGVLFVMASCLLNAISGIMDKTLTKEMDSGSLQFWYLLFLSLLYGGYLLFKEKRITLKTLKTNPWIIVLGILLALGDRILFYANADPTSKVAVMSAIKQSSVFSTLIFGKIAFGEKRFWYKIACASLIVLGAVITLLQTDLVTAVFGLLNNL